MGEERKARGGRGPWTQGLSRLCQKEGRRQKRKRGWEKQQLLPFWYEPSRFHILFHYLMRWPKDLFFEIGHSETDGAVSHFAGAIGSHWNCPGTLECLVTL